MYSAPSDTVDIKLGATAVYTPDLPFQFTVTLVVSPALKPGAMQKAMDVLMVVKPRPCGVMPSAFKPAADACSTKHKPSVAPPVGDPGANAVNLKLTDIGADAQNVAPLYQMAARCGFMDADDCVRLAYVG